MTNGGEPGTNGGERRARRLALAAFAAIGLGFAIVNSLSELDERKRTGLAVEAWEPWAWEFTSFVGLLLFAPLVIRASQRLLPPRRSWPAALALLALLAIPFSLAHVATMTALRHAIYAAVGDTFRTFGGLAEVFVYEFRKDSLTYALLLLLPHVARAIVDRPAAPAVGSGDRRIEVRDGSRTVWLSPADIDWAQAAGNYVELHGGFGTLLHRRTLAALQEELAPHGFVRIHRSRIVRRAAVAKVETRPSGDFEVTLDDGSMLTGSRRFRANLA